MKTLLSLALGAALTAGALAIPQTFNGGGFLGAAGINFEDFAGQTASFDAGAKLPGKWAAVHGKKDELKLELDAVVFGIPASEITASKSGEKVKEFRVLYKYEADEKRGGNRKNGGELHERVFTAIKVFTGKSIDLGHSVDYKGVTISVALGGNGDVMVSFTPGT